MQKAFAIISRQYVTTCSVQTCNPTWAARSCMQEPESLLRKQGRTMSTASPTPALCSFPSPRSIPTPWLALRLQLFGALKQPLAPLCSATRARLLDTATGQTTAGDNVPALTGAESYAAGVPCIRSLNSRGSPTTSEPFTHDRVFKEQQLLGRTGFSATAVQLWLFCSPSPFDSDSSAHTVVKNTYTAATTGNPQQLLLPNIWGSTRAPTPRASQSTAHYPAFFSWLHNS